jgi:hypothetical protein
MKDHSLLAFPKPIARPDLGHQKDARPPLLVQVHYSRDHGRAPPDGSGRLAQMVMKIVLRQGLQSFWCTSRRGGEGMYVVTGRGEK